MEPQSGERPDDADGITQFVDALYSIAERAVCGRSRLRMEEARDIAHEAYSELSEEYGPFPPLPTLDQAKRAIDKVSGRMQKRRQRRQARNRRIEAEANAKKRGTKGKAIDVTVDPPRPPSRRPVGVPTLCRHLAALGRCTRFEEEIASLVADAAAVVVVPPLFSEDQVILFTLAWRNGLSAIEIVGTAGTKTPRAVTDRLYRLSRKIENQLAGYLDTILPSDWAELRSSAEGSKKKRDPITPFGPGACERVIAALKRVIHRNPR